MTKTEKKPHVTYSQKYKKGISFNDLSDVHKALAKKGIIVYILEAGRNSNDTEFMTIKIDNIKV